MNIFHFMINPKGAKVSLQVASIPMMKKERARLSTMDNYYNNIEKARERSRMKQTQT